MPYTGGFKIHEDFDASDIKERLKYFDLEDVKKLVNDAIRYVHFHVPFWNEYGVYYTYNTDNAESVAAFLTDSLEDYDFPVILLRLNVLDDIFEQKKSRFYSGVFSGMKLKKMARFAVQTSVYHELCHAIVALDNMYEFFEDERMLEFSDEEQYCERFAIEFFNGENVPAEIKEFYKVFNKFRKKGDLEIYKGRIFELKDVFLAAHKSFGGLCA